MVSIGTALCRWVFSVLWFGPRGVEAALRLVAAAGGALFAVGTSLQVLALGRALIGLGVLACLMASFKAFSQWFPSERLPSLTATVLVAGGLGALSASVPVTAALPLMGWRGVFWLVGSAFLVTVPDHKSTAARVTRGQQIRSLRSIDGNRVFWRFAPQGCLVMGGFMATGSGRVGAFRATLGGLLLVQVLAFAWFLVPVKTPATPR